jgi:hypothetical protein
MATNAQIHANQLNSQRSTGPSSVEGRAAARFNALKHGMDAQSLIIPGEDPAELEALAHDYHLQFRPHGPEETFLVETLIRTDWNKSRLRRIETELLRRPHRRAGSRWRSRQHHVGRCVRSKRR